jgi:hypothetical protein
MNVVGADVPKMVKAVAETAEFVKLKFAGVPTPEAAAVTV